MKVTISYPNSPDEPRVHNGMSQAEVNRLINHLSTLQMREPVDRVVVKVEAD